MSENIDSEANNLCIPEDAFEQFQAISMYQEEEYITLPAVVPEQPKEPDPGELSPNSYDNEVIVTTENEVNSTVNENIEEMEPEIEQVVDNSCLGLEEKTPLDNGLITVDQGLEPRITGKKSRKNKQIPRNDANIVSNNSVLDLQDCQDDVQVKSQQESPLISSMVPRKRGRKPKPKPSPTEMSNISSTPVLSSDPENTDVAIVVKRKRGRPRKNSFLNNQLNSKATNSDKELSSELSGSDNRTDDLTSPTKLEPLRKGKRGRPRKISLETSNSQTQETIVNSLNDVSIDKIEQEKPDQALELEIKNTEQIDSDNKILNDCITHLENKEPDDDVCLSKLKNIPDTNISADENNANEKDKDCSVTNNSSENSNFLSPTTKKTRKGKGRPKKDKVETFVESVPVVESTTSITNPQSECTPIDDDTEDLSLSKLKELKTNNEKKSKTTENNNSPEVSTTADQIILEIEDVSGIKKVDETIPKRSSKMPVMSDFEYNVDSVIETNEPNGDNTLLVEDTSKRPVRKKIPKLRYEEESDEDPFANVELSDDDDEPRNRRNNKYYSDDEYVPGRRGHKDIDSSDSSAGELIGEIVKQKKKKLRKKSDIQSPRKKGKTDQKSQDLESDDVEICLQPSVIKPGEDSTSQQSKGWGISNEFENFIAKKIQGTSLQIKKLSASEPTENKALEIPVIDPEAKKTIEMCTQTNISTVSTSVQTSPPYDIPMKENVTLTPEQSEKACYFLNSIVKTTSELGTLMTQKSEDFIKKKINTTHVTDTMKMDYCVKKSFLLFKLAKHNLMQMEEDLAKQYEEFLRNNNLSTCRELPTQIVPKQKSESDSDCEIVEEATPVKATSIKSTPSKTSSVKKPQEKPKFNPKTVFLNKELSIKIAKKPSENKKLDIKGRHTVWINDTVMVKKVKPTQSFLAQDSRNKKPPDTKITTEMVSDFFKNYYHQKAESVCAPFVTTDWLKVNRECVCNYFVVKPVQFHNVENYSASSEISTSSGTSAPETNHLAKYTPNRTIVTYPETLLRLCFRIVKKHMHDKNHVKEVCQHIQNKLTDGKKEPVTLFRLSLRAIAGSADYNMERSPTPTKVIVPINVSTVPSLKTLCHQKMVLLLFDSSKDNYRDKHELTAETMCSIDNCNDVLSTISSKYIKSSSSKVRHEIKSLLTLCVEFIQKKQALEINNVGVSTMPKSLKSLSFEHIKTLVYGDLDSPFFESQLTLNHQDDEIMIEGLTINSVNTLSEEAFLNLQQSHTDVPGSPDEYIDDFDNEEHYEPDLNGLDDENQTEPNWESQVQMQELRSCAISENTDAIGSENLPILTQIKLEPLEDFPEIQHSPTHVKTEPIVGLDEMTIIPEVKPEVAENLGAAVVQRQNSSSYDCDTFEQFVASSKIMREFNEGDIYTQSGLRVRRQHEPDYEEDDSTMSLLVPQTYEPLSIETAKGRLMESSSDEDSSKTKKVTGKKKPDKRAKGRQKKTDPKTTTKEPPPNPTKEKTTTNEVANLTKKMKDRIRQEEKKDDSTDSETENIPLRLRKDKSKQPHTNKLKESEIQCNNVDSTDQVDEDVGSFTGFTAIDQNEISTYEKYMKFVYEKIIPEKEKQVPQNKDETTTEEKSEEPLIADEPVELLVCQPTLPIFNERKSFRRQKGKSEALKKGEILKDGKDGPKVESNNREILKELLTKKTEPPFIERHGWHCYTVNTGDTKLYQATYVPLHKLPESFVQTYFEYQGITRKNMDDQEIDRLTNLYSLNRSGQAQSLSRTKSRRDTKAENISEDGVQPDSPVHSDGYHELEPSDDEGANVNDEVPPPVAQKSSENTIAKNLLMNDNDSDSEGGPLKVKEEPSDGTSKPKSKCSKTKKKEEVPAPNSEDLMLTADKMMNKELTLLHAPVVVTDDAKDTPNKGPVTRNKQKSASKNPSSAVKTKNEEDSSSEEEKQWVNTKEKLLKRMGKKDQTSVDDAKRAKLVSEFIERRGDLPDSHIRPRQNRSRRSGKKFLERQKQLKVLSRELFGESSDPCTTKRSQASVYKGRRNIRKVIDKKSLARSTVVANMDEFERKRRLNARQTRLRELLGCEEGVNVLVINDEVCLEYDFEENRPVVTVHPFFTKVMKAHQYEGVKFMWDACFESLSMIASGHPGGGCILAHCMGLGKTLQVLALLHTVLTHPGVRMQRVLVCCPLSTVLNWVDEIHKWIGPVTNEIKVFELSKLKKTYERAYQLEDWYNGGGIFIIGYELFRSLSTLDPFLDDVRPTIINKIRTALLDPGPDIIVCDEGHLLKNDCSVLAVSMSRVVTKRRIILTGTPMQNNLREYYCMVNFVKPNLLGTYAEYSNRFENPIMNGQHRDSREEDIKLMKARTHILHKVLEGCLQRQEASVLYPYLPKKHEYTVFITLTPCQWDLYKHYLTNYGKQSKQSILKDFHILQKIWSHPQVLHNFQTKARDRDEKNKIKVEKLEDDLATEDIEDIKPNAAEDLWWLDYSDGGNMLETLDSSNKFVVVFRILDECIALGDKVLIFSTSLFCLDALEYFLKKINKWSLGQEYYRLDGSVPAEVRQKWCREFNADHNYKTKLFLVSTRAGCLGLNMTAANRVIIMDTSWNPAHDIQSIFRVYRFGQKKDCYIYRLVAMGTMEQKIYERSVTKQAVACRVVDEQQIDRHYNMAELTELYKFDSGPCVAGGVAAGVRDVALLRVARLAALHAVHEHDSLLRGSSEQGLPEHERNAAWMQFQQEQAHKQIENKLVVNIPNFPNGSLNRMHGHDYSQLPAGTSDIKQEDTSSDYNPTEQKPKRAKKSSVIKCRVPIQDDNKPEIKSRTRSKKEPIIIKPGTSKMLPSTDHTNPVNINQEEVMVEKITKILLKYNFQNKRNNSDISSLVTKVRNMVKKGFISGQDSADDLTCSIAEVLLSKEMSLPAVTNIMCESINNSTAPDTELTDSDTETITCDPTPSKTITTPTETITSDPSLAPVYQHKATDHLGPRTKRKAAIAAEKSIDSLAHDVVINLDDDEWDAGDTDFVPNEDDTPQNTSTSKPKKKSKNSNPAKMDSDENTLSADEVFKQLTSRAPSPNTRLNTNTPDDDKPNSSCKQPNGPRKPKDRIIKTYAKSGTNKKDIIDNTIDSVYRTEPVVNKPEEPISRSILLSDDDEPIISLQTTETFTENTAENSSKDEEVVPLPTSLLKNQNFINIVAHTYLVGNPMLDEDAATLAAQYSTLKALKTAEQTGKDICSGPIYDIAVKVIGKEILKKMQSANPKAASSSAKDAVTTIEMKEQMIASHKAFNETAKSSKAKSSKAKEDSTELGKGKTITKKKTREDMIRETLAMTNAVVPDVQVTVSLKPPGSMDNNVVPVGLFKTTAGMSASQSYTQPLVAERVEPRVECILPDDDDLIISDVRAAPAPPPAPPAPVPPAPGNKPIILNNLMYKPIKQGFEAQPIRVTVGNSPSSTSPATPPPKILIKSYKNRAQAQQPFLTITPNTVTTPPKVQASAPTTSVVVERILPNDDTICLDSDDEEAVTPVARPSTSSTSAAPAPPLYQQQAPVPVSLTMANAPGVSLPLPAMHNLPPVITTTPPQTMVLRQVSTVDGQKTKFVLIPSDQLTIPKTQLTKAPEPTILNFQPNTFQTNQVESVLSINNPDQSSSAKKTICKPGDILRIAIDGTLEVVKGTNIISEPNSKPGKVNTGATKVPRIASKELIPTFSSVDLTGAPAGFTKPKPGAKNSSDAGSVDLTDEFTNIAPKPTSQKPSTSMNPNNATSEVNKNTLSNTTPNAETSTKSTYSNKNNTDGRRVSNSSSSSINSGISSPENPLSILKDVVQIQAPDYQRTTVITSNKSKVNKKSIVLRTEKCSTSNIAVQHVVSRDSNKTSSKSKPPVLKLTKIPKDKVPKSVDAAAEKLIQKEALIKKISPLLSVNHQKTKLEPKPRGKNTINFDNLSSTNITSKILKGSTPPDPKAANKKPSLSILKNVLDIKAECSKSATTVDLTNIAATGSLSKTEGKKRQSSVADPTPVKKKRTEPMTLKDFNLDDIDDIIELD